MLMYCAPNQCKISADQGLSLGLQCLHYDMTANIHVYVEYIQACIMLSGQLFTFTHLADAFIQNDLHNKAIHQRTKHSVKL